MRARSRRAVLGGGSGAGGTAKFRTKAMRQNAAVREVATLLVLATDVSNRSGLRLPVDLF